MAAPRLTKQGRALLFKALRAIKQHPKTFSMKTFMHSKAATPTAKTPEPYCGTVACIAGHVMLAAGAPPTTASYSYVDETLPPDIRNAVKRATCGFASVPELATRLLVGRWYDDQVDGLFYDLTITRHNVDRSVRYWLRTGDRLPKNRARSARRPGSQPAGTSSGS